VVLPFANLTRDLETEILADGLTEEVISTLAHVPGLGVVARTSAFYFKNRNVGVREVGATLGVDMAVLDWSQCPAVERHPGKVSGAWILKGTRMPVAPIFENLEAGASIDDVLAWYEGLDRKQVQAVIEFAARSLDLAATDR
jgi:uncharacterized protein (DUF433 family)